MRMRAGSAWRIGWVTLLVGATGCGKETGAPIPCDNAGVHLVAFASDRQQPAGRFQIWLYDLDGQGFRLLRNLGSPTAVDSSPGLSPDGQLVAFVRSDSTLPGALRIKLYDRASCGFVTRAELEGQDAKDPAFTGDGLRLAFAKDTLGNWRIRVMNATGTLASVGDLADPQAYDDWAPAPSRSGSRIALVSNRITVDTPDGNPHIWVYDIAGDSLAATPGLNSNSIDIEPSLSPDGRWLCFASDRAGGSGGFDVYLYDFSIHALVPLPNLNGSGDDRDPAIRADGGWIVFQSDRAGGKGKRDLWVYSVSAMTAPTQGNEMGSAGDDFHPSLMWP